MIEGFTDPEMNAMIAALEIARTITEARGKPIVPDCPMATAHTKLVVTLGAAKTMPFEAMGVPSCN